MNKIGKQFIILFRQLNLFMSHELNDTEITASEILYLASLYAKDGVTQDELSEEYTVDRAATTRSIQALEKKGFIRRETDTADRRAKRVYLTEKAYAYEELIRAAQMKWANALFQDMDEEQTAVFIAQVNQMVTRARELNGPKEGSV